MLHHPVQHHPQLPQHPLHRLVRKPASLVRQTETRPLAHHRDQVQRIVRPLLRLHSHYLQPCIPTLRPVHRIVFKHHDALKQRQPPRHLAPALHLHQRRILVLPHLYLLRLQPLQPLHYLLPIFSVFCSHPHSHRQRVDEHSHHPLHSRQFPRPSRHRRAKHHIRLPTTVAAQQQPPTRLHQRVHRQPLLPRKLLDPLPSLSRDRQLALPVPSSTPHRPAHPQPRRPFHPLQRFPPVPFRFPDVLPQQPSDVILVRTHFGKDRLRASHVGGTAYKDFLQYRWDRPTVEDQMMEAPHKLILLLRELKETEAHKWRAREIK